jgi:hypothetical protein
MPEFAPKPPDGRIVTLATSTLDLDYHGDAESGFLYRIARRAAIWLFSWKIVLSGWFAASSSRAN